MEWSADGKMHVAVSVGAGHDRILDVGMLDGLVQMSAKSGSRDRHILQLSHNGGKHNTSASRFVPRNIV